MAILNFIPENQEQRRSRAAERYTEDQLAEIFEREHEGRIYYAHQQGAWYVRDESSGLYSEDRVETVLHMVREFLRGINVDGNSKIGSAATVASVEKLARRAPALAISGDELDRDKHLLGTPSGIVDLREGTMLPNPLDALITRRTAVDPAKGTPARWLKFLDEATGHQPEIVDYLQRLVGYCLTGETREEHLSFFHGPGGNGKGVFLGAIKDIVGDYGRQADAAALMESKGERHPADIAALSRARLVIASESSDGRKWDEQRVKALTGRDEISARFMRGNFFVFRPEFKILVASNHKPRIRTVDDAWRRRLHLVPFDQKPERPDPLLKDKLRQEYPQILQWAIEGAEWWYREGLMLPAIIEQATDQYFREEDLIGLWAEETVEYVPSAKGNRRLLYANYENWCKLNGHKAATIYALTRWFKARGFDQDARDKTRPIIGVRLNTDGEFQFDAG